MVLGIRHRKSIFFTLIALMVVTVILLIFSLTSPQITRHSDRVIKTRVETVNDFYQSLDSSFFERALSSSGYRALVTMIKYTNLTQEYIPNFESEFRNVVLFGGLNITGELGKTDSWMNMSGYDALLKVTVVEDEQVDQEFP